ncbi:MAG: PHP domain-containing protein [Candidatus Limnocylindrales bacterium]
MTTPRRNRYDFHAHSAASDGRDPPLTVYAAMRAWGLRVAALSDHDTFEGYLAVRAAGLGGPDAPPGSGPRLIPAIEINAVAMPGQDDGGLLGERHFLGYGLDPTAPGLQASLARQREFRRVRVTATVERLRAIGLPIEDQLAMALGPAVSSAGRPHVARALVAAGHASSVQDAFERFLSRGRPAYVPRQGLGNREAVEAIIGAGGLAVLAHTADAPEQPAMVGRLQDWGLGGLEVYYGGYNRIFRPAVIARLARFAADRGLVPTGGSDYHGDTMSVAEAEASTWVPRAAADRLLAAIGWPGPA